MILPGKHIKLSSSILYAGSVLLKTLNGKQTVSMLWDNVGVKQEIKTFDRFILGLDLLFILGLVNINKECIIVRVTK